LLRALRGNQEIEVDQASFRHETEHHVESCDISSLSGSRFPLSE
jgi:hypothetical protein